MNQTNSRAVRDGLKYIHETYGFMLQRGYEVVSVEDIPVGWQVVLRKADLVVRIQRTRGEEDISFRTGTQPPDEFFDIGTVVYVATKEKIPLSSYSDLSRELQKYLDTIENYFQREPLKIWDSLRIARKEYQETLTSIEVTSPKEPRVVPILHYPLLGMIILLLFGALSTLYMLLLDRLFSTFSLDAGSYGIFMGVISILLAIGTMALFWPRRKKG